MSFGCSKSSHTGDQPFSDFLPPLPSVNRFNKTKMCDGFKEFGRVWEATWLESRLRNYFGSQQTDGIKRLEIGRTTYFEGGFWFKPIGKSFFKNGPTPASFLFIFGLFKQTLLQFLQQIKCEKYPSSFQCRDSNSQPSNYKSPPLTTRP